MLSAKAAYITIAALNVPFPSRLISQNPLNGCTIIYTAYPSAFINRCSRRIAGYPLPVHNQIFFNLVFRFFLAIFNTTRTTTRQSIPTPHIGIAVVNIFLRCITNAFE